MLHRTCPPRAALWILFSLLVTLLPLPGSARSRHSAPQATPNAAAQAAPEDGVAEASLLDVYALMAKGQSRLALEKVSKIVQEYPNFQLAQLVYGDLLAARVSPVTTLGDVPANMAKAGKLAEQALILTKLFTREQLQVPVSNHFFEISEPIETSAINNINKFTEANKFQSAKSNYDGFASNNAPESAQNNDSTALIGVQPISAVGSEKEVAKSTPLEPKNALIDSPPISAVRSSGSANMASRLAEMGK